MIKVSFEKNFEKDLRKEDNNLRISSCTIFTAKGDEINLKDYSILVENGFLNLGFSLSDYLLDSEIVTIGLNYKKDPSDEELNGVDKEEENEEGENPRFAIKIEIEDESLSQHRNLFSIELPKCKASIHYTTDFNALESCGNMYGENLLKIEDETEKQTLVSKNSYLRYFRILLDKDIKKVSQNFLDSCGNINGRVDIKYEYKNFNIYCVNAVECSDGSGDKYVLNLIKGGNYLTIQGEAERTTHFYIGGVEVQNKVEIVPIEKINSLALTLECSNKDQFSVYKGSILTIQYGPRQHTTDCCKVTGKIYTSEGVVESNHISLYYLERLVDDDIDLYYEENKLKVVYLEGYKGAKKKITLKCYDSDNIASTCSIQKSSSIDPYFDIVTTMIKNEAEGYWTCTIDIETLQNNTTGGWTPKNGEDPYLVTFDFSLQNENTVFKNNYSIYLIQLPYTSFNINVVEGSNNYEVTDGKLKIKRGTEYTNFNVFDKELTSSDERNYLLTKNLESSSDITVRSSRDLVECQKIQSYITGGSDYTSAAYYNGETDYKGFTDTGFTVYQVHYDPKDPITVEKIEALPWREKANIRQRSYKIVVVGCELSVILLCPNYQTLLGGHSSTDKKSLLFRYIDSFHLISSSNFPVTFEIVPHNSNNRNEILVGTDFSTKGRTAKKPSETPNIIINKLKYNNNYSKEEERLFFDIHLFLTKYHNIEETFFLKAYFEDGGEKTYVDITIQDGESKTYIPIKTEKSSLKDEDLISFKEYKIRNFRKYNYFSTFQKRNCLLTDGEGYLYNFILLQDGITNIHFRSAITLCYSITNEGELTLGSGGNTKQLLSGSQTSSTVKNNISVYNSYFDYQKSSSINDLDYLTEYVSNSHQVINNSNYLSIDAYKNLGHNIALKCNANEYYPLTPTAQVLNIYPETVTEIPTVKNEVSQLLDRNSAEHAQLREGEVKRLILIPAGKTPTASISKIDGDVWVDSSNDFRDIDDWYITLKEDSETSGYYAKFKIKTNYPMFAKGRIAGDYIDIYSGSNSSIFQAVKNNGDSGWTRTGKEIEKEFTSPVENLVIAADEGAWDGKITWKISFDGSNAINTSHSYEYTVTIWTSENVEKDFNLDFPVPSIFKDNTELEKIYEDWNKGTYPSIRKHIIISPYVETVILTSPERCLSRTDSVALSLNDPSYEFITTNLPSGVVVNENNEDTLIYKITPKLRTCEYEYEIDKIDTLKNYLKSHLTTKENLVISYKKKDVDEGSKTDTIEIFRSGIKYAIVLDNKVYIGNENEVTVPLLKTSKTSTTYTSKVKLGIIKIDSLFDDTSDNTSSSAEVTHVGKILTNEYSIGTWNISGDTDCMDFEEVNTYINKDLKNCTFSIDSEKQKSITISYRTNDDEDNHSLVINLVPTPYLEISDAFFPDCRSYYTFTYEGVAENLEIQADNTSGSRQIVDFEKTDNTDEYRIKLLSPNSTENSSGWLSSVETPETYNFNAKKFQQNLYICKDGSELKNVNITFAGIRAIFDNNSYGKLVIKKSEFDNTSKVVKDFKVEYDTSDGGTEEDVEIKTITGNLGNNNINYTISEGKLTFTKSDTTEIRSGNITIYLTIDDGIYKNVQIPVEITIEN